MNDALNKIRRLRIGEGQKARWMLEGASTNRVALNPQRAQVTRGGLSSVLLERETASGAHRCPCARRPGFSRRLAAE